MLRMLDLSKGVVCKFSDTKRKQSPCGGSGPIVEVGLSRRSGGSWVPQLPACRGRTQVAWCRPTSRRLAQVVLKGPAEAFVVRNGLGRDGTGPVRRLNARQRPICHAPG